jgi:methylthioribose-1-phosphate isomerase
MNVDGKHYRTIWTDPADPGTIQVIDQTKLPHSFEILNLRTLEEFEQAIRDMYIRGAGLIGATAGYGMYAAALNAPDSSFQQYVETAGTRLKSTRPTAKNLEWAVMRQLEAMSRGGTAAEKRKIAFDTACTIADEDARFCRNIGEHGLKLIQEIVNRKGKETIHILTHCNAGWLAFVDYGSATAPIYAAHDSGLDIHVWVDETRPRNQGASLTAWELGKHGVPHDLIVDNTGGHLMQHGMVDMVIVGADRVSSGGDAANKIGTYLKALAANDNDIPFYVALPSSTFDWDIEDGVREIPIEERDPAEVTSIAGVRICPESTPARNFGFDVTPARLITALITERGVVKPGKENISRLYPEHYGH